jgi:RND family efflux transporter MFP subunit
MKMKVISVVLLAGLSAGCAGDQKAAEPARETLRNVRVITVATVTTPDWSEAVGTVRAEQTSTLSAPAVGTVLQVLAREGDKVERGQVLIVIDDRQPRAALASARAATLAAEQQIAAAAADHSLATATLKRYDDLRQKRSVSPQEYDEVKARAEGAAARLEMSRAARSQARAAVAEAEAGFEHTRVRAPFAGMVTERRVDPGALAAPGVPLMVVEDTRRFRLEAQIDESELQYLRAGDEAPVDVEAVGAKLTAKIVQVVPGADPNTRTLTVKAQLPADARLHSGLFGRLRFARGHREALLAPRSAVVERGQLRGVFVLGSDRVAALQYVSLGRTFDDQVEVLGGLKPGDRVVAEPGAREIAGKKIEAAP